MKTSKIQTIEDFLKLIEQKFSKSEYDLIERAARRAEILHKGQLRLSGEAYIVHPIQVAEIIVNLHLDANTVCAAILHDTLEDTSLSRSDLEKEFGKEIEGLVFGVTKIEMVNEKRKNFVEAETIRKMLFAMVKDVRVILVKLADRLHNMRTIEFKPLDRQKVIGQDTLDIYAPLAARLGISWMKDELEDLSLKTINPQIYQQIKAFVAFKKEERSHYLKRVEDAILEGSKLENLQIIVYSRAKHFFSIYEKMRKRNKGLDEIYDMLGIRILCKNNHECYIALGIVHKLWMPIAGRFKDYIAMPKANRYQSLHTTVMCYDGKLIEIQIRTHGMEETAEFGVAAHWLYKKQGGTEKPSPQDIELISRLQDLSNMGLGSVDFLEEIKRELLKDSIYVFTPQGDVIQLPTGATAIDFAFHIHTEIGFHAIGAKADGSIIPLRTPLKNTQVIEIITNPNAHPHIDWLKFIKTSKARHKVRAWINKNDESIIIEKNIVAKKPKNFDHNHKESPSLNIRESDQESIGIAVDGEMNMMIRFASCCNPHAGDSIIGYVSRGRGIIIHRKDCRNLVGIPDLAERNIEVNWESGLHKFSALIIIRARKNLRLFAEVERIIRKQSGHLIEGKIDSDSHQHYQEGRFSVELERRDGVKRALKLLSSIDGVLEVSDGLSSASYNI